MAEVNPVLSARAMAVWKDCSYVDHSEYRLAPVSVCVALKETCCKRMKVGRTEGWDEGWLEGCALGQEKGCSDGCPVGTPKG